MNFTTIRQRLAKGPFHPDVSITSSVHSDTESLELAVCWHPSGQGQATKGKSLSVAIDHEATTTVRIGDEIIRVYRDGNVSHAHRDSQYDETEMVMRVDADPAFLRAVR